MAREQLQEKLGVEINDCGLFIDAELAYLAATPDGIIGDNAIVEIKCPYAARQVSPAAAIRDNVADLNRIFDKIDNSRMNQRHSYYFQVQGQLHITQREYCVFAVWTSLGLKYTIVERDYRLGRKIRWEESMLPLL